MSRPLTLPLAERLASAVTHNTRIYLARRRAGRALAYLLARSARLSRAYHAACEAARSTPL